MAIVIAMTVAGVLLVVAVLLHQATRRPTGRADYVALGSSYAAGSGLGGRVAGAPFVCGRGAASYPRRLARELGLSLVDASCSGATAAQVLSGGQYFQRPQIAAVNAGTRLVTLTVGGNDLHYVGDLLGLAKAKDDGFVGWAAPKLLHAPHRVSPRDAAVLRSHIGSIVQVVRARAPDARIVVVAYPAILPPTGTCPALRLTEVEADRMRAVAAMLADATRIAARDSDATFLDMATLGAAHGA